MEIKNVIVGPLETNCYLLIKEQNCLIIDPGEEADLIEKAIGNKKVVGIIITHYHFDHIGALEELREKYQILSLFSQYAHIFVSFSYVSQDLEF